jgi:ethanolamine permease
MKNVVGQSSGWLHMLVWLGLFGLVASFHGIIIGYSRQIFALSRAGYLPQVLGRIHPKRGTPHVAILAGGGIGIAAIFSDQLVQIGGQPLTANIVTMSVFGAIVLYIISMASLFKLRLSEPHLERPFSAPVFPLFPAFALGAAVVCLLTMIYFNALMAGLFVALMAIGYVYFRTTSGRRRAALAAQHA